MQDIQDVVVEKTVVTSLVSFRDRLVPTVFFIRSRKRKRWRRWSLTRRERYRQLSEACETPAVR